MRLMDSGRAPKEKNHSQSVSLVMDTFIQEIRNWWKVEVGIHTTSRAFAVAGRNGTLALGSEAELLFPNSPPSLPPSMWRGWEVLAHLIILALQLGKHKKLNDFLNYLEPFIYKHEQFYWVTFLLCKNAIKIQS